MSRRKQVTQLPAPFLRRLTLLPDRIANRAAYPFNLPWLDEDFALDFTAPVTIVLGENGTGKSTLIEALAALSGYDEAGGGKGYRPVDHSTALAESGGPLAEALRASWLPKVTDGWFFRAESFFSVARYLDDAAREVHSTGPDFLSWSHGEGFFRFFEERMGRHGIYFLDEPESALSPRRQLDLLRFLDALQKTADRQVIMATHSPILMALPGAQLIEVTRHGLVETSLHQTAHFRLYSDFTADPDGFVRDLLQSPP
ncbi:MAG: AAA family ATPase [Rhodobacterales bacterium]|nr:AAA family ATPase [Rhodobacterales bacterium]